MTASPASHRSERRFDSEQDWHDLLAEAARRASRYLARLEDRAVFPAPGALAGLSSFDEPLPDHPCDAGEVLALLDEAGSPATVASAGRRYFGFVVGGALPAALAASWLAGAWDQNVALMALSGSQEDWRVDVR